MDLNNITKKLLQKYNDLFSANGVPEGMFKLRPAIPFVGKHYQNSKPKILSYASAENLCYAYDENLQPNDFEIHKLKSYEQFNRARYFCDHYKKKFPDVHMEPFNNGAQLLITRHILSKLGYSSKFSNEPYEFIEEISAANPGKFSIASTSNSDYASKRPKMSHSIEYIQEDFIQLKPEIVILPKTVFETINKIKKWGKILESADIQNVKFIQIYQLSFFNNYRILKQIKCLPEPFMSHHPYSKWIERIDCGKVNIFAHFSWIDNNLYKIINIKKS